MAVWKATGRGRAFERIEDKFRFRYLGVGFIWAWIYGSYETSAVYADRVGIGINADASWLFSASTVVVALFVSGVIVGRRGRALPRGRTAVLFGILACAGTVLSSIAEYFGAGTVLVAASGVLTGVGTGVLPVLWGQALAQLDQEEAELAIPATSLILLASCLVFPYLPNLVGVAATASLPLASGLFLAATYRDLARNHAAAESAAATRPARRAALPSSAWITCARMCALLFLAFFVTGFAGAIKMNTDTPFIAFGLDIPALLGTLCGVGLLAAFVFFAARPTFDTLFRTVAVLLVCSLALLPWADLWTVIVAGTMSSACDVILPMATFLVVVVKFRDSPIGAALGIGITQGFMQLGVLLGNLFGQQAQALVLASDARLFTLTLGLIALFSLSWLFYPTDRATGRPAAAGSQWAGPSRVLAESTLQGGEGDRCGGSGREGGSAETDSPLPSADDRRESICRTLAASHGLSGREAEILGYLARGRSQPYIREELVLSKNTVATHVKHIYQKLDVHSRQELLDLFEQ